MSEPPIVGLTGGMGAGKSEVSQYLSAQGWEIIDADKITRIVHGNPEVCQKIENVFGCDAVIYTERGKCINRKKLAQYAFINDESIDRLNQIMHPVMYEIARDMLYHAKKRVILDAALLFESGWDKLVDYTAVVSCPEYLRYQRVMARDGLSGEQIRHRFALQMKESERCRRGDYIIYNTMDRERLIRQVDMIF